MGVGVGSGGGDAVDVGARSGGREGGSGGAAGVGVVVGVGSGGVGDAVGVGVGVGARSGGREGGSGGAAGVGVVVGVRSGGREGGSGGSSPNVALMGPARAIAKTASSDIVIGLDIPLAPAVNPTRSMAPRAERVQCISYHSARPGATAQTTRKLGIQLLGKS